ncbi:MAG TPA: hypothetical protein VMC04_10900 [Verrucomicrobiae bacterium]|jgi:hypothetical protein|nr:hypothetical protein [Verrucomicrobiae bacterium]
MSKTRSLAGAALATLLSAAPGLAAQGAMSAPAERPSMFSMPHQVTGQVVAVNQETLMLTVRTPDRGTFSLKADTDTAPQLGSLKRGDRVKVTYKNSRGEMVATSITPA